MEKNLDYLNILEALGDGIIAVDSENQIIYINKKAVEIIGKEPIKNEKIENFFPVKTENNKEIIGSIIKEVKEKDEIKGLQKGSYIYSQDKKRKYISATITKIESNNIYQVVLSIRDITNIIRMENEILEQKNNLENINNALPLGLIILDENHKVVKFNKFIANTFGSVETKEGSAFLGEVLRCSNIKNKLCGFEGNCERCELRKGLSLIDKDEKYITKKIKFKHTFFGKEVYRDYQVCFVNTKEDQENQILVMLQDITEQVSYEKKIKKAKDDAIEANRLKSEFLSNMSHEIRTPLNGIIGMIDLTRRELEDENLIENLDIAKSSSVNLLNIINSILDISKIEAGKLTIFEKPFYLEGFFNEVIKENKHKAKEKNIQLSISGQTQYQGRVISDKVRIKQVMTNLVDNAIKFTEEGKVEIIYKLSKKSLNAYELSVNVKDTGIGIEDSFKNNVFESFTQADGSYTRKKGGTGLGLAISKKIIKILGGDLNFKSNKKEGTDFYFSIPIKVEKEIVKSENNNKLSYENDTAKSSNKSIQSSKIGTILLVEDDLINQKILKTHLEYNGHSVYLAENGKKAVEIFNSNINFDLIFMDIQMPVMTGLEAVDIIRKTQKGKAVPIIALTALALKEDKENILKHDFDLYITKPIELYKLTKIVNEVLNGEKLIFENTIFGQVISFEEPKTEDEKEIILKEHIVSMRKLLLEKRFKELEEKAQVLVDYFNTIKDEEKKLISFKLIMNIRKENWKKCFELIQNLKKELEYKEGDYNENLNS